jgi:hypothetical protein
MNPDTRAELIQIHKNRIHPDTQEHRRTLGHTNTTTPTTTTNQIHRGKEDP